MNSSYNSYGIIKPVLCSSPVRPIGPGCTFAGIYDIFANQGFRTINPEWANMPGGGAHPDVFPAGSLAEKEGVWTVDQWQRLVAREKAKKMRSLFLGLAALGLAGGLVTFGVLRLRKRRKS